MLNVVIFASDESQFEIQRRALSLKGVPPETVHWLNSKVNSRGRYINENLNKWLLFVDHDCVLSEENLKWAAAVMNSTNLQAWVYAGLYANPVPATPLQKVHNFIANTWLEGSYREGCALKLVLGGAFLIFSAKEIPNQSQVLFWGAEDKWLAYCLNKAKYNFTLASDLRILHQTSSSFKHFLRRAYLHGKNESLYLNGQKNEFSFSYWLRKIDFADLHSVLLILLHFSVQRAAQLFQKILRSNTK